MLCPTVTRFHIVTAIALLGCALSLWYGSVAGAVFVGVAFCIAIMLGTSIPQLRFFGPFICDGKSARRWVALTFDDGPDAQSTPPLLDLLRETETPATFFCIGKRVGDKHELMTRILKEGHIIGNHSFTHSKWLNFLGVSKLRVEMTQTQAAIKAATGVEPLIYRPPWGYTNPRVFQAARKENLSVIGWTARGFDTITREPKRVVDRIVKGLRPGAIILLHDGNIPPERLLKTVNMLLAALRSLDYEVVPLDKLLE